MATRRKFALSLAGAGASVVLVRGLNAMQVTQNFAGPMQQDAYLPVKLEPKPGAQPSMSDQARDDLEHQLKCQCGCVLDVFTCRTTDFSCSVSPAMHADIMGLVAGGYNASEILAAFQKAYGERVLMSPVKRGFNLLGYFMPFATLIGGGIAVAVMIRRWGARAAREPLPPAASPADATPAELESLAAAVKDDS